MKYQGNMDILKDEEAFWLIKNRCGIQEVNVGHSVLVFKPCSNVRMLSTENDIREETAQIL